MTIKNNFHIVFLSICNKKERACVVKGTGTTLETAWKDAEKKVASIAAIEDYKIIWAKADIVNSTEEILTVDLNKEMAKGFYPYFYRKGISFDANFDVAFLECEINGNNMLNYYTEDQMRTNQIVDNSVRLNLKNINNYQKEYGRDVIYCIPNKITVFATLSFFCGEDNNVYELYSESYDKGLDCGRRIIDKIDKKVIEPIIINASKYLYNLIQSDGKFIYGYFPVFDHQMNQANDYNILRHASSLWSLINLFRITNDTTIITKLDKAINYMIDGYIEYKNSDIAYVIERKYKFETKG